MPKVHALRATALFFTIFFLYMLFGSRERPWGDGRPIYEVAESIVVHHAVSIATRWPPAIPTGVDGKIYAVSPLLPSLIHVPGAAWQSWISTLAPKYLHHSIAFACHFGPVALSALTCVLFFSLCLRMRVSQSMALWATAAVGLATTVAVYARYPYSEALQTACFTGLFSHLVTMRDRPRATAALALGVWAGLLINAKWVFLFSIPGILGLLVWTWRQQPKLLARMLAAFAAGLLPLIAMLLLYNDARWGSLWSFGSKPGASFVAKTWIGLWGLFLSPGKSVFLYAPPLLLTLVALPRILRRCPWILVVLLVTAGPVVGLSATLLFWTGDYAWGPRYLVFAVPALLLPGVLLWDDFLNTARRWGRCLGRTVLGTVLVVGLFVQVLGSAFHWDHFIRIGKKASQVWLGTPNSAGSPLLSLGVGCGSCFEEMYGLNWLPPFQPIVGHWWMLKHVSFEHDWVRAEADAPWHTYTQLPLDIADVYNRVRPDWWMFDWWPQFRTQGITLAIAVLLAFLASLMVLLSTLRTEGRRSAAATDLP
jgi:hypothetical protein